MPYPVDPTHTLYQDQEYAPDPAYGIHNYIPEFAGKSHKRQRPLVDEVLNKAVKVVDVAYVEGLEAQIKELHDFILS